LFLREEAQALRGRAVAREAALGESGGVIAESSYGMCGFFLAVWVCREGVDEWLF
jgi:hypothetical protein